MPIIIHEEMPVLRIALTLALLIVAAPQGAWAAGAGDVSLEDAQHLFYNGRYAEAAAASKELCTSDIESLVACELRTSALLFQLRRALGPSPDREEAFRLCATCAELLTAFVAETRLAQTVARARLASHADEEQTLFFLGKLDLNYVWLQLGTLGRKTGWDEYWEARRSLDKVLKKNPGHVRAKVARAWIDYIVDTKMPRGTRWLLGGGNKERGLRAAREAALADADPFARAEAGFALWDMQVRERNLAGAVATAGTLALDFPANPDLRKFLEIHAPSSQ
jgi:hypothetical protein